MLLMSSSSSRWRLDTVSHSPRSDLTLALEGATLPDHIAAFAQARMLSKRLTRQERP